MNRTDFMNQLESLLQNISPAEREEALQYYNEYFNDAGAENEQDVIEALGNPAKVAENIKRDLYGNGYGDTGYHRAVPNDKAVVEYMQNSGADKDSSTTGAKKKDTKMSTGMIVLIVVLCILASPVIIGAVSSILGALGALVVTWFSLIIGAGVAAIALLIVMVLLLVIGIMNLFTDMLIGVGLIGAGLFCGGIGILCLMLTVALAGVATPAIGRGIANLCKLTFGKKQAV